ncbi:hypothetical protein QFZ70_000823 [Arthrobacter sp. V1I9]|nr:hypothetical protein [Arthrobacter sp. V1I9]
MWVDAIVWSIAATWTMFAMFSAVVVLNADDAGVPILLILMLVAGAALGLVVVLRALLRQAAAVLKNGRAKAVHFSTWKRCAGS